jgi:hypothetical protein
MDHIRSTDNLERKSSLGLTLSMLIFLDSYSQQEKHTCNRITDVSLTGHISTPSLLVSQEPI